MDSSWQTLLSNANAADSGASLAEHGLSNPVVSPVVKPTLVALQEYALLDVTGADAQSFLQGQFCNDLAQVTTDHAQLSGYCNPKGRLLALFTVLAVEGGYRLIMQAELLEGMRKRLQMFVMRAEVVIAVRDDLLCTGVVLPSAETSSVDGIEMPTLPAVMDVQAGDQGSWVRYGAVQYLYIAALDAQQVVWNAGLNQAGASTWRLQSILAGRPGLYSATVEQFVPQMVNLQQSGGLSFTKGCYPGQEIVARMQYLGKLKRQMLRFQMSGSDVPEVGASVSTGDGSEAGVVVDAVATCDRVELLAVMKLSLIDEALVVSGQPLLKQEMPYEL